jgi:hypothetical protein
MWYCVKRVAEVEVDSITLPLRINQQYDRTKINNKICNGRFSLIYPYYRDYIPTLNGGKHINE